MVKGVKGVQGEAPVQKPAETPPKEVTSSRVVAPDEFIRKNVDQFVQRFASGVKYLSSPYVSRLRDREETGEGWRLAFRDVIHDILQKSGLDSEDALDFVFDQYTRFLRENPRERDRVRSHIKAMQESAKLGQIKKS